MFSVARVLYSWLQTFGDLLNGLHWRQFKPDPRFTGRRPRQRAGQHALGVLMNTFSSIRLALLAVAATFCFPGATSVAEASTNSLLNRVVEGEAGILKQVVVSYLGLIAAYPDLRFTSHAQREETLAGTQMDAAVSSLLFLFDSLNDPESLRVFASLESYYLGEHSAEIYNCLARRKGHALEAVFRPMLSLSKPECIAEFGYQSAEPKPSQIAICLTKEEAEGRIKGLIHDIDLGVGCTDEELLE